jgi:hypothetical protein
MCFPARAVRTVDIQALNIVAMAKTSKLSHPARPGIRFSTPVEMQLMIVKS